MCTFPEAKEEWEILNYKLLVLLSVNQILWDFNFHIWKAVSAMAQWGGFAV